MLCSCSLFLPHNLFKCLYPQTSHILCADTLDTLVFYAAKLQYTTSSALSNCPEWPNPLTVS